MMILLPNTWGTLKGEPWRKWTISRGLSSFEVTTFNQPFVTSTQCHTVVYYYRIVINEASYKLSFFILPEDKNAAKAQQRIQHFYSLKIPNDFSYHKENETLKLYFISPMWYTGKGAKLAYYVQQTGEGAKLTYYLQLPRMFNPHLFLIFQLIHKVLFWGTFFLNFSLHLRLPDEIHFEYSQIYVSPVVWGSSILEIWLRTLIVCLLWLWIRLD